MTLDEYKEETKKYLRQGMIVVAPRQCGKTTALLEVAKEFIDGRESVTVQVPDWRTATQLRSVWRAKFPDVTAPTFEATPEAIRPTDRVLIDEKSRCQHPYGMFFAAVDSLPAARMGFVTPELAERYGKANPCASNHVKVILPMFTWDYDNR
jgi:hypothetical protein